MLLRLLIVTALGGSVCACTSAKLTGQIEGEPICQDFALGGANLMKGSLRQPVQVTILDDDDPLWERLTFGRRSAEGKSTIFAIADEDEEYTVRWAQCPNAFAPKSVDEDARTTDRAGSYTCGEAVTYKESKLVIRAGDASSRVIPWEAPPEPRCWGADQASPATSGATSAAASAPSPAPEPAPSAMPSAMPSASAAPSASAQGSAAASTSAKSPTPAPAPAAVPQPPQP